MIKLNNVSKTYKSKKGVKTLALDNISFELPDKGLIFILGKSGSGKSTLLNIIGGLDKYDSGEILIDNKNTTKFKGKDFDYYRNTYIGFIFQEFNLLEEYNVYDNIILSKKLQKEKAELSEVDNLLAKVGIEGLGKRKINELSGGQKQRVAIARALIKNPEIILADEPTGSLDEETGRQIFSLLKEISKEKLVIVVSHDKDSANFYADGILEITDGKIISNSIKINEASTKTFKSKKSKLPFLSSLKFAYLNLGAKKLKLFFTVLLVLMSLVFFGTSRILSEFHIEHSHANTMVEEKEPYVTLRKAAYNEFDNSWYDNGSYNNLTKEDISNMNNLANTNTVIKYILNENNESIGLDIDYKSSLYSKDNTAYYLMVASTFKFIEADPNFLDEQIIGKYPTNYDEVMIHSYLADYIMKYGVLLYSDDINIFKQEYYKPSNYQELISSNKYLKLGSTKVKVSGIILDETEKFENLKSTPMNEILNPKNPNQTWLGITIYDNNYYEFERTILINACDIYVTKGFTNNINLKPNTTLDGNLYSAKVLYNNKEYYLNHTYSYLEKEISVLNGDTITNLNDNEIIINESFLDRISNNNYSKLKEQYIKNYNNSLQEGNEVIYKSDEELKEEFIKNYVVENNIINSSITFTVLENESRTNYDYFNVIIKGIQLIEEDKIYIANNILSNLMRENYNAVAMTLKSNDAKKIEQIFLDFPTDNSKYLSGTVYTSTIKQISTALENISKIAFYASIIFGVFAFVLLTNFIVNSIYYSKKSIGILRGLGARKTDVFKIFLNEGLMIGIFSLVLSIITLYIAIYFANNYISSHLFFNISFIELTLKNIVIITASVIGVIFVSSLFTVRKIVKMNPVDAILNK